MPHHQYALSLAYQALLPVSNLDDAVSVARLTLGAARRIPNVSISGSAV